MSNQLDKKLVSIFTVGRMAPETITRVPRKMENLGFFFTPVNPGQAAQNADQRGFTGVVQRELIPTTIALDANLKGRQVHLSVINFVGADNAVFVDGLNYTNKSFFNGKTKSADMKSLDDGATVELEIVVPPPPAAAGAAPAAAPAKAPVAKATIEIDKAKKVAGVAGPFDVLETRTAGGFVHFLLVGRFSGTSFQPVRLIALMNLDEKLGSFYSVGTAVEKDAKAIAAQASFDQLFENYTAIHPKMSLDNLNAFQNVAGVRALAGTTAASLAEAKKNFDGDMKGAKFDAFLEQVRQKNILTKSAPAGFHQKLDWPVAEKFFDGSSEEGGQRMMLPVMDKPANVADATTGSAIVMLQVMFTDDQLMKNFWGVVVREGEFRGVKNLRAGANVVMPVGDDPTKPTNLIYLLPGFELLLARQPPAGASNHRTFLHDAVKLIAKNSAFWPAPYLRSHAEFYKNTAEIPLSSLTGWYYDETTPENSLLMFGEKGNRQFYKAEDLVYGNGKIMWMTDAGSYGFLSYGCAVNSARVIRALSKRGIDGQKAFINLSPAGGIKDARFIDFGMELMGGEENVEEDRKKKINSTSALLSNAATILSTQLAVTKEMPEIKIVYEKAEQASGITVPQLMSVKIGGIEQLPPWVKPGKVGNSEKITPKKGNLQLHDWTNKAPGFQADGLRLYTGNYNTLKFAPAVSAAGVEKNGYLLWKDGDEWAGYAKITKISSKEIDVPDVKDKDGNSVKRDEVTADFDTFRYETDGVKLSVLEGVKLSPPDDKNTFFVLPRAMAYVIEDANERGKWYLSRRDKDLRARKLEFRIQQGKQIVDKKVGVSAEDKKKAERLALAAREQAEVLNTDNLNRLQNQIYGLIDNDPVVAEANVDAEVAQAISDDPSVEPKETGAAEPVPPSQAPAAVSARARINALKQH